MHVHSNTNPWDKGRNRGQDKTGQGSSLEAASTAHTTVVPQGDVGIGVQDLTLIEDLTIGIDNPNPNSNAQE